MTVQSLMSRTGTLVTVTVTEDAAGNLDETTTSHTVPYELQQQQRSEGGDQSPWQVGVWRLFLPACTSVAGVDRFIDDQGRHYTFEGPAWEVHNPRTGRTSHVEATLRSVA